MMMMMMMMMMLMMMMMATTIGNKILETKSTHLNLRQDFISSCLPGMGSFTPTMSMIHSKSANDFFGIANHKSVGISFMYSSIFIQQKC